MAAKIGLVAAMTMGLSNCAVPPEQGGKIHFYVGSTDGDLSHSIFLCSLEPATGTFAKLDSFGGVTAGGYLALSPDQNYLYSVNQAPWKGDPTLATVTSFSVDPGSLKLTVINSQSSGGSDICHIYCSRSGNAVFAANYGSGHAAAFPVSGKGEIEPASSVVAGPCSGPLESRQQGPHAHQVRLDPGQHFLLVPDLGCDRVRIYAYDASTGSLTPNPAQPYFELAPGTGPRHLAFHPDGRSLFIVNELNSTLTACSYDPAEGTMAELVTVPTVEESHPGMKYPAAVRVHPGGKFVYASTRGENSCISTFRIHEDRTVSRIQVVEHVPNWPRDFNVDPTGRYMLVAGERSDEIRLYLIDPETGLLTATEGSMQLSAPSCILFTGAGAGAGAE